MGTRFEMVNAKDLAHAVLAPGEELGVDVLEGHALVIGSGSEMLAIVGSLAELRDLCETLRHAVLDQIGIGWNVGGEHLPSRGCPRCRNVDLLSWEMASVGYPVRFTGPDVFDYTDGDSRTSFDGARYADELSCRACNWMGGAADLVDVNPAAVLA